MAGWRIAALGLALAAYAVVSHRLMSDMPERAWTVAVLFGPLLAAVAIGGWQRRHGPTLAACAAGAAVLAAVVAQGGVTDVKRLYVLQHAAIHALLAWSFAATLRPGSTPLITAVASRVHEHFPPAMQAYTRGLTLAWVLYFVAMIALSFLIYGLAPWPWWSFYCNLVTPVAAGAMFVLELAWRRWRHPEFERVSIASAVRAYRATTAGTATAK